MIETGHFPGGANVLKTHHYSIAVDLLLKSFYPSFNSQFNEGVRTLLLEPQRSLPCTQLTSCTSPFSSLSRSTQLASLVRPRQYSFDGGPSGPLCTAPIKLFHNVAGMWHIGFQLCLIFAWSWVGYPKPKAHRLWRARHNSTPNSRPPPSRRSQKKKLVASKLFTY